GFVVREFSLGDIYDAIELRGAIEGTAARLAAERLKKPADVTPLAELNERMTELARSRKLSLDQVASYVELNSQFHNEVLRLSHSPLVIRAMEQVCSLPFASPSAFLHRHNVSVESQDLFLVSVDHHRGIIESIR